jgi:hypothetical protein
MPLQALRDESRFRAGVEDVIILPLAIAAVAAKRIFAAAISVLVRLLDYAFLIAMQLARLPLFVIRILLDGAIAGVQGLLGFLPMSDENRRNWQDFIRQKWSRIRQMISYKAFEEAVHRIFESGMEWVFRKCRTLRPRAALYVLAGAVLWLPISLGLATAIHAALLAYATSLPPWMQLLHPLATVIAKSKLLVLPAYPAAWPQAKKDPLIQMVARGYESFEQLFLIQKLEYRYGQAKQGMAKLADALIRALHSVGLIYLSNVVWSSLSATVSPAARAVHGRMRDLVERLSRAWLIGPAVRSYFNTIPRRNEKLSEKAKAAFERWSIKFSAEYYEAKAQEEAARAGSKQIGQLRSFG